MAAFFWIHASGVNNNWATNGNWSATSGGGSNAAQPSVTSDVTFDGAGTNGNDASTIAAIQSVLTLTFTTGYTNTITINQVLTIAGNFTDRTQHTWTGGAGLVISAASTITSNGKTFPNTVTFTGSNTKTLVGDWTISSTLITSTATTTINKTTAETINCAGLTINNTTAGNINITLTGGTWSGASGNTITGIITFAGNVIVSGSSVFFSGGTIKYTSGTITTTGSTLALNGSVTLDTNGVTWNNITITGTSQTYTINSLLTVGGTLLLTGTTASTFAGTAGFSVNTLSSTVTAAYAVSLKNSLTYVITASFSASTTRVGAILSFASDDGTLTAGLILNWGATCNVLASFTRINAFGGRSIQSFNGTITSCTNVFAYTDVGQYQPKELRLTRRSGLYNRAINVRYSV